MAIEQPGFKIGTLVAAASSTAYQYHGVYVDSSGKWALAQAGQRHVGVLQNAPAANEAAEVVTFGVTKAVAGGIIAAGAAVSVDASGHFITSTDADQIAGVALESAGASGDIISLWLSYGGEFQASSPA